MMGFGASDALGASDPLGLSDAFVDESVGQTARVGQFESPGAGLVSALYSAKCDELQPTKVTYVIA
jgi:hypothetical protein